MDSGPNGDIGVLTSDNDDGSFLFAQECKTFSGESGKNKILVLFTIYGATFFPDNPIELWVS